MKSLAREAEVGVRRVEACLCPYISIYAQTRQVTIMNFDQLRPKNCIFFLRLCAPH